MLILEESIGGDFAEVGGEPAHGEVHLGQLVGGGGELIRQLPPLPHPPGALRTSQMGAPRPFVLPVDGDVLFVAVVAFHKFERLNEHAAGAAARIINLALVGLDHFGDEIDDALRGVELMNAPAFTLRATLAGCRCRSSPFAPELALGGGELAEEVLIRAAALTLRATLSGSLCRVVSVAPLQSEDSTLPRSLVAVSQRDSSKDFAGFLAAVFFLAGMDEIESQLNGLQIVDVVAARSVSPESSQTARFLVAESKWSGARSCTAQPASASWWSIVVLACSSAIKRG